MEAAIESILVSGRGELAERVAHTCHRMGIEIVGSDAPPSAHPLLPDAEATVALATKCGAKALHPGYVGPRVRAELALLARGAGLIFVGPSNEALAVMADKVALRTRADTAGLRIIPGSGVCNSLGEVALAADDLGYPVFIKAVSGTAGIGLRRVEDEASLEEAYAEVTKAAAAAFGDERVYVETALARPRQLEVTVVADAAGSRVALQERDCSVQRCHQVLVAESPSPWLETHAEGESIRSYLAELSLSLAADLSLTGVFTVEFLIDMDDRIFFLEANADMQGAVLVTEMLTGQDPIELALAIAAGANIDEESRLAPHGHAFEVRLCAEDPAANFSRDVTPVSELHFPAAPHRQVRVEPAVEVGEAVAEGVEPLLARLATFAPGRHDALLWLDRMLAEIRIEGPSHNAAFLRKVTNHEAFRAGAYDTSFTQRVIDG